MESLVGLEKLQGKSVVPVTGNNYNEEEKINKINS